MLHSIVEAAGLFRFNVRVATPPGYEPEMHWVEQARQRGARIQLGNSAADAVRGADVVVTDTWVSMGQDGEAERKQAMRPFQVDEALMAHAAPNALFLHCLPAHVGDEVTEAVFESPQSVVFDEAENRLHAQKSILLWCLGRL